MNLTTNSYNKLAKSNNTLWETTKVELWSRVYKKIGEFMENDGAAGYYLEKDGTYAFADRVANSAKLEGFWGKGAPQLVEKLSSQGQITTAQRAALSEWNSAGKWISWGTKAIVVLNLATSGYAVYTAENRLKEITKQVAGWSTGLSLAGTAGVATLETGPGAAVVAIIGFGVGYFVGSEVTEKIWQWTFERGTNVK